MNQLVAIAVNPNVPDDLTFADWIETLKTLAGQRRNVDWMLGDWLRIGQERFPEQIQMELLGGELGMSPKRLKTAVNVSSKFPAHARDETLSIEHHAHVVDLPREEQLDLLTKARREHWSDDHMRKEVISRKVTIGMADVLSAEEYDQHSLMSLQHAWNRASTDVRSDFLELATQANGGVIDA